MIVRRDFLLGSAAAAVGSQLVSSASSAQDANSTSAADTMSLRFATNRLRTVAPEYYSDEFRNTADGYQYETGTMPVVNRGTGAHPNWQPDPLHMTHDTPKVTQSIISASTQRDLDGIGVHAFLSDAIALQSGSAKAPANASMVFLHGYAYPFLDTFQTLGDIASGYGNRHAMCFCWPSHGDHKRYPDDRDNAYASGAAVALFLTRLLTPLAAMSPGSRPLLNLVCHSMGNRVLSAATQILGATVPDLLQQTYFEHTLLMAADEDYDAFGDNKNKLAPLLTLSKEINVYTNGNDGALFLSELINHKGALGAYGPKDFPPQRGNMYWIDCSEVSSLGETGGPTWGHQYFHQSPPVIADARAVLSGALPASIPGRSRDADPAMGGRKFKLPAKKDTP